MSAPAAPIDPGQFDDAPEDTTAPAPGLRQDTAFIDLSDAEESSDLDAELPSDSEDSIDEYYDDTRVEDEDWEWETGDGVTKNRAGDGEIDGLFRWRTGL